MPGSTPLYFFRMFRHFEMCFFFIVDASTPMRKNEFPVLQTFFKLGTPCIPLTCGRDKIVATARDTTETHSILRAGLWTTQGAWPHI
jgi:hypothetical protein